jgi:hypothetical protein
LVKLLVGKNCGSVLDFMAMVRTPIGTLGNRHVSGNCPQKTVDGPSAKDWQRREREK